MKPIVAIVAIGSCSPRGILFVNDRTDRQLLRHRRFRAFDGSDGSGSAIQSTVSALHHRSLSAVVLTNLLTHVDIHECPMFRLKLFCLFVCSGAIVWIVPSTPASAVRPESIPSIETPPNGATVFGTSFRLSGKHPQGSPLALLMRSSPSGSFWKVIDVVDPNDEGRFVATITLPQSPKDRRLEIVAVGAPAHRPLSGMRRGSTLRRPPENLVSSLPVKLTLAGESRVGSTTDQTGHRFAFPFDGAEVAREEIALVEGIGSPVPVVLVKADLKNEAWYPQSDVEDLGAGRSLVRVRFGSRLTPEGTRFLLRLATPETPQARERFRTGHPLKDLPDGVAYGSVLSVRLNPRATTRLDATRLRLEQRLVDVSGLVAFDSGISARAVSRPCRIDGILAADLGENVPVVMVRSEEDPQHWYVQPPCEVSGNRFRCQLYVGSASTPPGTAFQVIALLVPTDKAGTYKPGDALRRLPEDCPLGRPIRLMTGG